MNYLPYTIFASTYDCSTYGSNSYSAPGECITAADGGSLTNTGQDVIIGVGSGLVLIVIAIALMLRGRRKKTKATR